MQISITSFQEEEQAIRHIRGSVFVKEQGIPSEDEYDDNDNVCVHAIAWDEGRPVGTGRLSDDGRVGGIAVMKQARGKGIAKATPYLPWSRTPGNAVFANYGLMLRCRHWDSTRRWATVLTATSSWKMESCKGGFRNQFNLRI